MQPLIIRVDGIPKGQPRARKGQHGWYTPSVIADWKASLSAALIPHRPSEPIAGLLWVSLMFHVKRPQRLMRKCDPPGPIWCGVVPDVDNCTKVVCDVLQSIDFICNDAIVCGCPAYKCYHAKGDQPGVLIRIEDPPVSPDQVIAGFIALTPPAPKDTNATKT